MQPWQGLSRLNEGLSGLPCWFSPRSLTDTCFYPHSGFTLQGVCGCQWGKSPGPGTPACTSPLPVWVTVTPYSWHLVLLPLGHSLGHQLCTCPVSTQAIASGGCGRCPGSAGSPDQPCSASPSTLTGLLPRAQMPARLPQAWKNGLDSDKVVPPPVELEVDGTTG